MPECYYHRLDADGDTAVFESTDYTRSNWTPEIQHGSPPLALLTKHIEALLSPGMRIGRLTLDILGAIPVTELRVRARVERPGTRIAMLSAEMSPAGSGAGTRPVARVAAWALRTSDTADAATDRYPRLVEGTPVPDLLPWKGAPGYVESVQWRPQQTPQGDGGTFWLSPLVGLVDDEDTTALQQMALVVDSANGIGAVLDPREFVFMNTDTTVHLHRLPVGNDFGIRARASIGPDGVGVTSGEVYDRRGFIGTTAQTLLVQRVNGN